MLSLLLTFLPLKIYPLAFLLSSGFFYREARPLALRPWGIALVVFGGYALVSFGVFYSGDRLEQLNMLKLLINFLFLVTGVQWLSSRDNTRLIQLLDQVLTLVFILTFVQLLVYHWSFDFRLISGSSSSGQGSALYRPALYYWGLDDKNMFGARIALLGFIYLYIPVAKEGRLSLARISAIFLLAFLSLSRTPVVALLLGVVFLFWISFKRPWRIALIVTVAALLPFLLQKILRIDSITSSNDGMGIRLVYWKAFFRHFGELSPLGQGFQAARDFLPRYADFYRGEPHIHNTFFTTYLEFGIIGLVSYVWFFIGFFRQGFRMNPSSVTWTALGIPILAIMMILYSGYDNDIVLYLVLAWLVGTHSERDIRHTNIRLL